MNQEEERQRAEEKLRKLGDAVQQSWKELHPATEKELNLVHEIARRQFAEEQKLTQEEREERQKRAEAEERAQAEERRRKGGREQDRDEGLGQ